MNLEAKNVGRRMQAFREACASSGLKVTPQRTEIFREVASTTEHPDAETIHRRIRKRMSNVSLDTVYRTLYRLEEEGLVSRLQVVSDRVRFDANPVRHHHFVCTGCGLIRDFHCEELDGFRAPPEVCSWGEVRSCHVEVRGLCSDCLAESRTKARRL